MSARQLANLQLAHRTRPTYKNGYKRCREHGWLKTDKYNCTVRGCNRRLKIRSRSPNSRATLDREVGRY